MSPLARWVFAFIQCWFVHWDQVRPERKAELQEIAVAIADASEAKQLKGLDAVETAAWLTNMAKLESGFTRNAIGKAREVGFLQLMPPPRGAPVPIGLESQALEAIRRWETQGPAGYTGETGKCEIICPLALNRELGGQLYLAGHPFTPEPQALTRQP